MRGSRRAEGSGAGAVIAAMAVALVGPPAAWASELSEGAGVKLSEGAGPGGSSGEKLSEGAGPGGSSGEKLSEGAGPADAGDEAAGFSGEKLSEGSGGARGVDAAAALSAAAERRMAAGDRLGAIGLWREAFAALPGGYGYAPRRAAAALAIAGAEEAMFRDSGDPRRLRAAIAALDGYLGGLDPTDDENRARVEDRRAALADALRVQSQEASAREGPEALPGAAPRRGGLERRAGLVAAGLAGGAGVAGVIALAGGLAGVAADRDLARATARPCQGADPADICGSDGARAAIKADALTDGLRANQMATVGVVMAGALLAASAAALVAGALRGRARVQARGAGLIVRF